MTRKTVEVRWTHGLHLRPAARLVRVGQQFRATILLRLGERCADVRSVLSIISLCAIMGASLDIEAAGDDEEYAAQAVEQFFATTDDDVP